ncbi:ABC transporter substrate-binding protein [Jeongeupia sp. USM3]|uniref:ABC transporter substrate-binding protein n=1 Tax=Jeongeupia sp. USM3 TaxID=1906741 RepID=UPI00089DFAFE|nr:ABC transporter substrate-binding protein [Jeongeupia sp. USM3]AOY02167.1 sugar ABC transporter substrate-binding protein [Jeongeupia sp. USM3]
MKKLLATCLLALSLPAQAGQIEVLHYWTLPSEVTALALLKSKLGRHGLYWKDFVVPGGGGESAYAVLQARAIAGDPPMAALMEGPIIQEWASLGFLAAPYPPAREKQWDAVLPAVVRDAVKYKGRYVALPTDLHRINWMLVNPAPFDALKLPVPASWDAFFKVAPRLKAAGYIPLSLGKLDWQETTLFESVLLGLTDGAFYRKVFVEQDSAAINSARMVAVLERFRQLRQYAAPGSTGKSPEMAAIRSGRAAMFIMGDWAKADLVLQGMVPGKTLRCVPAPGTAGYFVYGLDSFALFRTAESAADTQAALADVLMNPALQSELARRKGAIPPRTDASHEGFDSCGLDAVSAFRDAEKHGRLLPSMAHSMATSQQAREVFFRVISYYFNHPEQSSQQAARQIDAALQALRY